MLRIRLNSTNALNADSIAQTMILFLPQEAVGIRVNCAVHVLRYMRLGLPAGERKDNGFAFLIVVEPEKIDVHYGVGLGLPALTASELTPLNRAAEAAYESSGSMDEALLTPVREFDAVSRANYAPLPIAEPTAVVVDVPELPAGPAGLAVLCIGLCLVTLFIMFMLWIAYRVAKAGIDIGPRPPTGSGGSTSSCPAMPITPGWAWPPSSTAGWRATCSARCAPSSSARSRAAGCSPWASIRRGCGAGWPRRCSRRTAAPSGRPTWTRVRTMVRRNDIPVLSFFRAFGFAGGSYVQLELDVSA